MEIGPILRALARNKTRFVLIAIEVALTLAIVINCVNMMLKIRHDLNRPTGIDENNIVVVRSQPFAPDFKEEAYLDNARKADVALLSSLPGVRAAEAISNIPLSGSGSSSGFKPLGSERQTLAAGNFSVGSNGVDTLGVKIIAGRNFQASDINDADSKNVIITKAYADALFPDGNALGKQLQGRTADNPNTIVGILEIMHASWPQWRYVDNVVLFPGKPGSFNNGVRYLVRTVPGQRDAVVKVIEEQLLKINNGRNVIVDTLAEIKAREFMPQLNVAKMFGAVIVLLLFVTALGIVGITSFSVTERTRQIGTRRAIGARKQDILRYFLTENWLITTLGMILGVVLTYGLNYLLMTYLNGTRMDWPLVALSVVGMWLVGLGAALFPALRGSRISPAIATRSV